MPTHKSRSAAEELADETGEPIEKFKADEYEYPDFDDLETLPEDEWED